MTQTSNSRRASKPTARSGRKKNIKKSGRAKTGQGKDRQYWSHAVTKGSDALDLEQGVFTLKDPRKIALSLKRSAEASTRRKAEPFRSAMSMLVFYINRAGKNLKVADRARLEKAKDELRELFHRKPAK